MRFHPAMLFALLLLGGKRGRAQPPGPRPRPPGPGPSPGPGTEVPIFLSSGTLDANGWVKTRFLACSGYLAGLPELAGRAGGNISDIAISIVAHWAIETEWGTHEYNYNLGGIHAPAGVSFFRSTDAGVPTRFEAWTDLNAGVAGYVDFLRRHFAACWAMLTASPPLPWAQWYDCLGAHGYYGVRGAYEDTRQRTQELVGP